MAASRDSDAVRANRDSDAVRVGVLFSQTGATALIESTQLNGTVLAIEEINAAGGINGRALEPVIHDPGSRPSRFSVLADRLLTEDGVNVIFGCYMSSTRKAVLPVVERRNGLLFYPTLYEGFEYSPNIIYTGAPPNQNSVQLADYLINEFGARFYLVGSDYIYAYESNRIMSDLIRERNGAVVAEKYVTLDARAGGFDAIIKDIKRTRPDVIFSTVVGKATTYFYRAYAEAGLEPDMMPIGSLTTSEAEVQDMGVAAACGHVTAAPYFQTIDTEINRRFVTAYKARFGAEKATNMCCEAAYFQVHLMANAMRKVGTDNTDILRPALMGTEYGAPQGQVRIDPDNNHTYLWPRVGRVDDEGQFAMARGALQAVKPDPYLVTHSLDDWNAKLATVGS